ncbi:COX15/CtaA family protein [Nemorincola caseinilytica]|uniref:COX15/CtaA family protein n=1 Tax=Nemorincola caseinilytica TaxID=2054315 RepID=A0ABP8NIA3_9BACT
MAWWLIAGIIMIVIEFIMGGVTRLTGSGLSITEWKPIMGFIPPLNEADWNKAFDGYKNIAQYKYVNSHFTLPDFKFIFYWEWAHRLWARMLGVVFAIGFVYFFVKKYFDKGMVRPFIILFILGGLQGFVGWKMVASGLNDTDLYVKHTWLAAHFLSAITLMCYTLWFALVLLIPADRRVAAPAMVRQLVAIILLTYVQLAYGAFMAGTHASRAVHTWPRIADEWVPGTLGSESMVTNVMNIQFVHRTLAYLLLIIIVVWYVWAGKAARRMGSVLLHKARRWPFVIVMLQVVLGVVTLISASQIVFGTFGFYETLAEIHQLVGMFLVMALVANLYIISKKK